MSEIRVGVTVADLTAGTVFVFVQDWTFLNKRWSTRVPGVHFVFESLSESGYTFSALNTMRGWMDDIMAEPWVFANMRIIGQLPTAPLPTDRMMADSAPRHDRWLVIPPDAPGDGGDIGGDWQAGTAWERSFGLALDSGEFAVLSYYVYTEFRHDELPGMTVTLLTAYLICTDWREPGSTETWSTHRYGTLNIETTDEATKVHCSELPVPTLVDWKGQIF